MGRLYPRVAQSSALELDKLGLGSWPCHSQMLTLNKLFNFAEPQFSDWYMRIISATYFTSLMGGVRELSCN